MRDGVMVAADLNAGVDKLGTIFSFSGDLVPGDKVLRKGDVTQLIWLVDASSHELESRLGYEVGRLRLGWYLLLLVDSVSLHDFTWGGTTECSGGTDPKNVVEFQDELYRVPVEGVKRWKLSEQMGGNGAEADSKFDSFRARQLRFLNERRSHERIAKVVPVVGHDETKFWLTQYPDAAAGKGVRQWTLTRPKSFLVAARIAAGQTYAGGGAVA